MSGYQNPEGWVLEELWKVSGLPDPETDSGGSILHRVHPNSGSDSDRVGGTTRKISVLVGDYEGQLERTEGPHGSPPSRSP